MEGLYILPFDHRSSFMKLVRASPTPTRKDVERARAFKLIIYDAFRKAVAEGVPKDRAAILVDEWLGRRILLDARSKGFITCVPLERSGQDEFQFERADWKRQLAELKPSYAKVLVRYNPEGDKKINSRQAARLAMLSNYLNSHKKKFLFELLVPATKGKAGAMIAAIRELQNAEVNPDIWKLEGIESAELMQKVAAQVISKNTKARIVILGAGDSADKVKRWLRSGSKISSVIGFAVGRTVFSKPLEDYATGRISRQAAVDRISDSYSSLVAFWERLRC